MKTLKTLFPLVLAGSVAFAGQSGQQTAPKPPQHKAPLSMSHSTATPAATPGATGTASETKAGTKSATGAPADAKAAAPAPKISKEQAGTIAAGSMKGAEVSSAKLKESGGKQVWAVTLMEGGKKHEVLVDANEGTLMKNQPKHTTHHKESAPAGKH